VERLADAFPVANVSPIAGAAEFDRRMVRVRITNAGYDAHLGRLALAKRQMGTVLEAAPSPARPIVRDLLAGHLFGAAAHGALYRKEEARAYDFFEQAESAYRRAISGGGRVPNGAGWTAQAYKSLGMLYQGLDEIKHRPCEAKAAFEKYLELAPSAS